MMKEGQKLLRWKFYASTDIEVDNNNLSEYERWLEKINIDELNNKLIAENNHLRKKMSSAIKLLYEGISQNP